MDIYKAIETILIEKTPFVFSSNDDIQLYQEIESYNPFASLRISGKRLVITIYEFPDWTTIKILMRLGHDLLEYFSRDVKNISSNIIQVYNIESIIINCECDMDEEFVYEYRMNLRPWYFGFGYIPYLRDWRPKKLKDFFQIPFLKPDEYLDLKNSKDFICPNRIILKKINHPLHIIAQKDPNDLHLRLLPSTSFYKRSKRPITSMNLLRGNKIRLLDLSKVKRGILISGAPFKIGTDFYIPVTRYSNDMNNGCYFNSSEEDILENKKNKYLGTFYYWEPDSTCYLRMGKRFEYFETKFECATVMVDRLKNYLDNNGDKSEFVSSNEYQDSLRFVLRIDIEKLILNLEKYIQNILYDVSRELKNGYEEYLFFERNVNRNDKKKEVDDLLMNDLRLIYQGKPPIYLPINNEYKSLIDKRYMGQTFYAAEDELDQFLAQALIVIGHDVVVFGRMAGLFRVVSEVFDVRPRTISFDNLCWRVD